MTKEEIENELYLYHCAGSHTRSQMARAKLEQVGFKFKGGLLPGIYWPDGTKLTYDKSGNIVKR